MSDAYSLGNLRNIVMLGITGSGKSSTGNSILDKRGKERQFESKSNAQSITKETKFGKRNFQGKELMVIDTPGYFDTTDDKDAITKEILKCAAFTSLGFHALLLVTQIGRFTEQDQKTVEYFFKIFGEQLVNYLIIVFTHADNFEDDGDDIDSYVSRIESGGTTGTLKALLSGCDNRYIAFNNRAKGKEADKQVTILMEMVEVVLKKNGGRPYVEKYIKEAERIIQEEIQERLRMKIEAELIKNEDIEREENKVRLQILKEIEENRGNVITRLMKRIGGKIWSAITFFIPKKMKAAFKK